MITRLACAFALFAVPLSAAEKDVTLSTGDQSFVGTLSLPEGDPAPVVLLLHGFTGSRHELASEHVPEGVYGYTAARLREAGYASLRIDFRGSGESMADLTFADTTFEGQIADALAALDYLDASEEVAGDAPFVIGWSQGGLVASAVAGRSNAPKAVALWNAVGDPPVTYGTLFGAETMAAGMKAEADAPVQVKLPWAEFPLKGGFFEGIAELDPYAEIASFGGPLLVVSGKADTLVDPAQGEAFLAAHGGAHTAWTGEMDHVFNVFTESDTLQLLVTDTIAFFDAQ